MAELKTIDIGMKGEFWSLIAIGCRVRPATARATYSSLVFATGSPNAPMLRLNVQAVEMEFAVNTPVVLMLTTVPGADAAATLAQQAIDQRLAACVTELGTVRSRYRWQGAVELAEEIQLLFKTSLARSTELARFIEANHPYGTPELLSWQADASPAYGQWITVETQRPLHV
jgi:periplasmic divalent cation tolerance protein